MQQTPRRSFTRLALAICVPLVILLTVYYAGGNLSLGGEPWRLVAEAPSEVALKTGEPTPIQLKLKLTNRTGEARLLTASNPCKILRWVVQAPGEVSVQSKGTKCVSGPTETPIASGETIERLEILSLDSVRYTPGVTYTIYVDFYGILAKAEFDAAAPDASAD